MISTADQIIEALAHHESMTYSQLRDVLKYSETTILTTVNALVRAGRAQRVTDRSKGNNERTMITLTVMEAARWQEVERAPDSAPRPELSGHALTAKKILASLQTKTARHLAAAGGYSYPRAAALLAEIEAAK